MIGQDIAPAAIGFLTGRRQGSEFRCL